MSVAGTLEKIKNKTNDAYRRRGIRKHTSCKIIRARQKTR